MSDDEAAPVAESEQGSPSVASSAPPNPQGQQIPANQLHPLWQQAARGGGKGNGGGGNGNGGGGKGKGKGGGRGGGRGSSDPGDGPPGDRPRFERISLAALEAGHHADADGADSALNSEDEDDRNQSAQPSRKRPVQEGPRRERAEEDSDEDDDDDRRDKLDSLMGAAVFGGNHRPMYGRDMDESEMSESSSRMRKQAEKDAFPVRGVNCVGCALSNRIGPVDVFVRNNVSKMTDEALFKMAALCYKRDVAELAEREGVSVPAWAWKDVRSHYMLHSTGNTVSRHMMIRCLQNMRAQAEQRLVRVDNGETELDRGGADLMLKVCHCLVNACLRQQLTLVCTVRRSSRPNRGNALLSKARRPMGRQAGARAAKGERGGPGVSVKGAGLASPRTSSAKHNRNGTRPSCSVLYRFVVGV
tara:strand:+ start:7873 stop:9120 length:1248 start_codon:yes stop_codon:yes gene_type:complete